MASGERDVVRHPRGLEAREGEFAHLHRMVDELVVVRCAKAPETVRIARPAVLGRQRGDQLPVPARLGLGLVDGDEAWRVGASGHRHEHAGAIEEAMGRVEVGRTHRQVPGIDLIVQHQRARPGLNRRAPGVLVELLERARFAIGLRGQADDVARELPDHVAARNPRRQAEHLALRIGLVHGAGHLEQMRARIGGADAVFDGRQIARLRARERGRKGGRGGLGGSGGNGKASCRHRLAHGKDHGRQSARRA